MIVAAAILKKALDAALSTGADFADIFVEDTYSSQLSILNAAPQKAIVGQLYGAGIRLFYGHEIIYVTTNDLSEQGLTKAALSAAKARPGVGGAAGQSQPLLQVPFDSIHEFGEKPWEMNRDKKFAWLNSLDEHARAHNSAVTQVGSNLLEKFQRVQIANSLGLMAYDERAYSRIGVETFVEHLGVKESSHDNYGQMGTSELFDKVDLKDLAQSNVDRAFMLTTAKYAPAGEMPVVIDNSFGGVIFHEACGHGLETTSVAKNASVFCGKLGEKIAHESVTAIDDGTIENGWGSLNIDDEGNKTQKTVLIENGILKSYIVDEMGAKQTGYAKTGSGRRQSYKFAPASRMRNTFIGAGKDSFESMISDVDYGIYAKKMGGGSVNPGTGDFNFAVTEAYIVRNGKIQEPVKGASLIGRGIDVLGKISKVSNDLKLATGMCGSVSGTVPAAVGQPQILVSSIFSRRESLMDAIKESFEKIQTQARKDSVFVEMLINGSDQLSLSFNARKLDEFSSSFSQAAGFRVVLGSAQGYAWTENFSEESLLRAYQEALSNARVLPQSGKPIPVQKSQAVTADMSDLYFAEDIDTEKKMEKAKELEGVALDQDSRISAVPYSGFSEVKSWKRILSSEGLDKTFKQSYYSGYAYPLAKEGEVSKIDGYGFIARRFAQSKTREVAEEAAKRALSHLGAKKLATGTYPVVIDREVAKDLVGTLGFYFSAKNIFEKKSLLQGKLGQSMASEKFNLSDDPLNKSAMGVRPFDAEGSPSQKTTLLEKGVVKNYLTNLEYAEKMNLPHTASASRSPVSDMGIETSNLIVDKGQSTLQNLLGRYPKMIHLTTISGGMHSGFKETTGDFSLPGEAFLYENGKCLGPVDQFVFSGNIFEMLKNVEDLSDQYCDSSSTVLVPDLLVKELSFAGA